MALTEPDDIKTEDYDLVVIHTKSDDIKTEDYDLGIKDTEADSIRSEHNYSLITQPDDDNRSDDRDVGMEQTGLEDVIPDIKHADADNIKEEDFDLVVIHTEEDDDKNDETNLAPGIIKTEEDCFNLDNVNDTILVNHERDPIKIPEECSISSHIKTEETDNIIEDIFDKDIIDNNTYLNDSNDNDILNNGRNYDSVDETVDIDIKKETDLIDDNDKNDETDLAPGIIKTEEDCFNLDSVNDTILVNHERDPLKSPEKCSISSHIKTEETDNIIEDIFDKDIIDNNTYLNDSNDNDILNNGRNYDSVDETSGNDIKKETDLIDDNLIDNLFLPEDIDIEQMLEGVGSEKDFVDTNESTFIKRKRLKLSAKNDKDDKQNTKKMAGDGNLCKACGYLAKGPNQLSNHIKAHNSSKCFICDICKYRTVHKPHLVNHIHTHMAIKTCTCDCCGKSFTRNSALQRHMMAHSGERPFPCKFCSKRFSESSLLRNHLRIHTGEKPFSCSVCHKSFTERGSLKRHVRIHTGDKKYACSICKRQFSDSSNLKNHQVVHTVERKYSCDICLKKFKNKRGARSHQIRAHERDHACAPKKKLASDVCGLCGKVFGQKHLLENHLRSHTKEKPFSCDTCGKAFGYQAGLRKHWKIHLARDSFSCYACDKTFVEKDNLNKHLRLYCRGEKAK